MTEAKRLHCPSLKDRDWQREGFGPYGSRYSCFKALQRLGDFGPPVSRVDAREVPSSEFMAKFEAIGLPVVIRNVMKEQNWADKEEWLPNKLRCRFKDVRFKCGEDDEGYSVKVKLKYFLEYMRHQQDDSPLYVFDSHFDEHPIAKSLLEDYTVPHIFPDDLFSLVLLLLVLRSISCTIIIILYVVWDSYCALFNCYVCNSMNVLLLQQL